MSIGYRCIAFPLQVSERNPQVFINYLERLGLSPIWSIGERVVFDPLLGGCDQTGEKVEMATNQDAMDKLLKEDLEVTFTGEKVVLRVSAVGYPQIGRFAAHHTCDGLEREAFQRALQKAEITMHDLSAAFAQAFGAKAFSFQSARSAVLSIQGEVDADYLKHQPFGVDYPELFAGLPEKTKDFYVDSIAKDLTGPYKGQFSYVQVQTSIGEVFCLAAGTDHAPGSDVQLCRGMGRITLAD